MEKDSLPAGGKDPQMTTISMTDNYIPGTDNLEAWFSSSFPPFGAIKSKLQT